MHCRRWSMAKEVVSVNDHFSVPRNWFKTLTTLFPGLQQSEMTEDINHWVETEINYPRMKPLQAQTGALLSSSLEWLDTINCLIWVLKHPQLVVLPNGMFSRRTLSSLWLTSARAKHEHTLYCSLYTLKWSSFVFPNVCVFTFWTDFRCRCKI